MRFLKLFALTLSFAVAAQARVTTQSLQLIDGKKAVVEILDKKGQGQAAAFVDGTHNDEFIELLLKTPGTTLHRLAAALKKENDCGDGEGDPCGDVVVHGKVMNLFGRGGWATAGASYRYMLGWREAGTGHFFEAKYTFEINEDVEVSSEDDNPNEGPKTFLKTLLFNGARDISKDVLDIP